MPFKTTDLANQCFVLKKQQHASVLPIGLLLSKCKPMKQNSEFSDILKFEPRGLDDLLLKKTQFWTRIHFKLMTHLSYLYGIHMNFRLKLKKQKLSKKKSNSKITLGPQIKDMSYYLLNKLQTISI